MNPDILVIGVGRSGTTNTARILHDQLGICMGYDFALPHEPLPYGGREQHNMLQHSHRLVEQLRDNSKEWLDAYSSYAHGNECCNYSGVHGIKQTVLSLLNIDQLVALNPKLVIRTYRPMEQTIKSLMRWRGYTKKFAEDFFWQREEAMRKLDHEMSLANFPFTIVDYSEQRSDEEIYEWLNLKLK